MYSKPLVAAALAVASLGVAAHAALAAAASPGRPLVIDPDAPQAHVSLAGLHLDRPADARIAYDRIHKAAEQLCGREDVPTLALDRAAYYRDCVDASTDDAVERLGSALVVADAGARG